MYCPRWLFLIPGTLLVVLGTSWRPILFFGPVISTASLIDLNTFISSCLLIVVGMQLLSFGAMSRYFAAIAGFLPQQPSRGAMVRHATTDRLALLPACSSSIGSALFGYAVSVWASADFGPLADPIDALAR